MADERKKKYPFLDADTDDQSMPPSNGHASDEVTDEDTELFFEKDNIGEILRHQNPDALDDAGFGVIKVNNEGIVEFFNKWESELSGVKKDEAEGRNFFTQVAPCTNNRLFRGRFKKGVRRGELDETFTYTYTYKMRPTLVEVHMYRDDEGNNWIMVQKF